MAKTGKKALSACGALWALAATCLAGQVAKKPVTARGQLQERGIEFTLDYTGEVLGNVSGGLRRGAAYNGLLHAGIAVDFGKLWGWKGLSAYADGVVPHGESFTSHYGGDLATASNIEFYNSPRLFEVWLQQDFSDGLLSIRAGMLALDSEFTCSQYAAVFINSAFGATVADAVNMSAPLWPIAAPGLRIALNPSPRWFLQTALYEGNPAPGFIGDPSAGSTGSSEMNRHGTQWALRSSEGMLMIAELGYRLNPKPDRGESPEAGKAVAESGLQGTYRIGYSRHTDEFTDYRAAAQGRVANRPFNQGAYLILDQELWREPGTSGQGLGFFARGFVAPKRQNRVDYEWETGLVYTGAIPGRGADTVGLGIAHIHISSDYARAEAPGSDYEAIIEATYRCVVRPGWELQPDVQYIMHPGGSKALSDEWVLGLRTRIVF